MDSSSCSPSPVVQYVVSLTADPGVVSLISAQSHTFMEIDLEIFSSIILLLPLIQERVVVSYIFEAKKCARSTS